jgi:5'-nucleotidase
MSGYSALFISREMPMNKPAILLTNDDGIRSPGLWAAAEALSALGFVHVVAPREQSSGTSRSLPPTSDGIISRQQMRVRDKDWTVYSVGGTPAQAVLHAIYEILPERPQLVVAGINYGENVGVGITVSGTIGAALEAAESGIPALAISLETSQEHHRSYSTEIDFSTAAYFAKLFGRLSLECRLPPDVDILKVDVPCNATPQTPWVMTHLSRQRYYEPVAPDRQSWDQPKTMGYRRGADVHLAKPGTDVHALIVQRRVAVTPLSLDITSRVDLGELERLLSQE